MRGLGTLINVLCIVLGGCVGLTAGRFFHERLRETLLTMMGLSVIALGLGGTLSQMLQLENGALTTGGTIMMIVSLALGSIVGELLNIEGHIEQFGQWLKERSNSHGDSGFVSAFVNASCTVCIGAMAIIGSVQDGIRGDTSVLVAKGLLDAIIICIMTAAQGKGCIFSAIPVALLQGSVTLLAVFLGSFLPERSLSHLSYVGNLLIVCVGLNLIREKHIRVANALPSIVLAIVWGFFA